MRKKTVRKALLLGALLAVALPGIAYANTVSVTVQPRVPPAGQVRPSLRLRPMRTAPMAP